MKKGLTAIIMFLLFCVLGSYSQDKVVKKDGMYFRGEQLNKSKLTKNQFLSVTKVVKKPTYLVANDWSKVETTSNLLDELKAHKDFTNPEKYRLLSYIFEDLPINSEDGIVREIYIGDYFDNRQPLEIRVGIMTPQGDALQKNQKVVIVLTNAVKMKNGEINKTVGFFGSFDSNACTIAGLNGSKLTNVQRMKNGDSLSESDISKLDDINQVMLIQAYLADEDTSNDELSNGILLKLISKKDVQPAIHIMAMLKRYEFLLSSNSISEAEVLWNEIKEYSINVPGDMNPDSLESINGESLYLMKELKKNSDT